MSLLQSFQVTPERHDEWLKARENRIGGSEIATAIGLNKYDSQLRLWLTKTKRLPPEQATDPMEIGSILEPAILELYRRRTKKVVTHTQVFCVSPDHDYLCATLDAITDDGINVQVKNTGHFMALYWGSEGTDEIPHEYLLQVQQEMLCSGLETTHVVALIGGNNLRVYEIRRDETVIQKIIKLGKQFIDRVRDNVYPEPDPERDQELIKYLFPGCDGAIEFDNQHTCMVQDWEGVKAEIKRLEIREKKLKMDLSVAMGEASQAALTDGRTLYRSITHVKPSVREVKGYSFPVLRVKEPR